MALSGRLGEAQLGAFQLGYGAAAIAGVTYEGELDAAGFEVVPGEISGAYSLAGDGAAVGERLQIGLGIGL